MDKLYLFEKNISTNIHWIVEVDPESRKEDGDTLYSGTVVSSPSKHRRPGYFSKDWNVRLFDYGALTPEELINKIYG